METVDHKEFEKQAIINRMAELTAKGNALILMRSHAASNQGVICSEFYNTVQNMIDNYEAQIQTLYEDWEELDRE